MSQMSYHPEEDRIVFSPESLSQAMKMRAIFADSLTIENRRVNKMLEQALEPYLQMIRKFIDRDDFVLEAHISIGDRRKLMAPSKLKKMRDTEPWVHIEFRWMPLCDGDNDEPVDFEDKGVRVKRLLKKFSEEIGLPIYVQED